MAGMLKPSDVAADLNCSDRHVRRLCSTGQLPAMRLSEKGRADWRISPDSLSAFKAAHTTSAELPAPAALPAQTPVLIPLSDMDGALPYGWWETPATDAVSPAARSGGSAHTKKAASQR